MAPANPTNQAKQTLADRLRARISREGPITFYEWMKAALYDSADGYYCANRMPQGRSGDYRTAPETSPLFAATFARYFAKLFGELGSPQHFTIVEAGCGAGDFALGVLDSLAKRHPHIFKAISYLIDETSNDARGRASARLAHFTNKISFQRLAQLESPFDYGVVFSNELLDAFPVHRVVCRGRELRELCVGFENDHFVWVECAMNSAVAEYCRRLDVPLVEDQIVEVNLEAEKFIARAASALKQGFMVTVDYGAGRQELLRAPERQGGTLRAFRRHQLVDDVLSHPGEQDLTTTIDWTQIREAGESAGLKTILFQRLDQFLLDEGLLDELEEVTNGLPESEALRLRTSARELIMPDGMAASFQVLVQRK